MIMNLAWVQSDLLVYYTTVFEFSLRKFSIEFMSQLSGFARISKNNLATGFYEAPCRISMIGMESRI